MRFRQDSACRCALSVAPEFLYLPEGGALSISIACSTEKQMLSHDPLRRDDHERVLNEPPHVIANAVEISSPLIRLLTFMISAPYLTLPAQCADHRTLSTSRLVLYASVSFYRCILRALCGFGRKRDQGFLIDERLSVTDGISPNTVR